MTDPAETRRLLRIVFSGDSVRGSLDGDGGRHRFVGWLELLAAIDALRTDVPARGSAEATSRPSASDAAEQIRRTPPPRPRHTNRKEDLWR
jgi:hypothetical protein